MDDLDLADAATRYRFALPLEDRERLPFYTALLEELEADPTALELLAGVRAEQRNPMLVLAILHYWALSGHEVLQPIYDAALRGSLEDPRGAARQVINVVRNSPDLVRQELWRSTQTNEPGRSAVLQAVIADLVEPSSAINVIEVGTSAGINLWFDQFPVRDHDDLNPLTLVCDDLSPVDRSRALPRVLSRVGIDPHPLNLDDENDQRWLKACLWVEERRRHQRLEAIIATHSSWPDVNVLEGSVLTRMDDAFALCDPETLTVVYNTWVAFYFTPEDRSAYFRDVARRCATSNVAWVSIESTLVEQPNGEADERAYLGGACQIVVTRPGDVPKHWGWCHAHGRWLDQR